MGVAEGGGVDVGSPRVGGGVVVASGLPPQAASIRSSNREPTQNLFMKILRAEILPINDS